MGKYLNKSIRIALLLGGSLLCVIGLKVLFSPPHFQAMARIVVRTNAAIASPQNNQAMAYDPNIVKTILGIISSPPVLSNVVETLNLNDRWGKKYAEGKKLTTFETIELLKRHISHVPIRNTMLIEIWAFSDDSDEAAKIANQVADSLEKYCLELSRQQEPKSTNVSTVQIVDFAVPPQTLSPPNSVRIVGAFLSVVGLLSIFVGFKFLEYSRHQSR
jgi:capsular polysaccharide biosynthesis protein